MELKEYKDYAKIKHSKELMARILKEVRDETKQIGLTFQNYIVGSGKHKMIFVPKNETNRSTTMFDIDMQISFQKFNWESIKKSLNLRNKIDYDEMMRTLLGILNKKMANHGFQNVGGHHRIQAFHKPSSGFCYEILFVVERETNDGMQWNEVVYDYHNGSYILNEKESYYDPLWNFKNSKKSQLKREYKELREESFDEPIKIPNFELLNLAIWNLQNYI